MKIGEEVRRIRELQGLSQEELAERIGTKQPAIARLEACKSIPKIDFLEKVAEGLGRNLVITFG